MTSSLPPNVHVSQHPCLRAKLSQLRSGTSAASARDVKGLVHDISLIVGCEALASCVSAAPGPRDKTPLGFEYETTTVAPETISIVPILRSGLGMVEAIQTLLPTPVPVHHLGLYREPTTLEPVEYYNNLPEHISSSSSATTTADAAAATTTTTTTTSSLAFILDPVIATGGTCAAAIQTLREWGAQRIVVLSVLGAEAGVKRAAAEWPGGVDIWLAAVDEELTGEGMLKPGLGDVGDRLFLTIGK